MFQRLTRLAIAVAACAAAAGPAFPRALQVGHRVPFPAGSPHPYPTGRGDEPAWSVAVEHPGATYIAIHFDRFDLGPGDRVVVRSGDGRQRHMFTGRGKGDLGAFWATHVRGERAIVELFSPGPGPGGFGVSIDAYAAGDVDLQSTAGIEAICGSDDKDNAVCFEAGEPEIYDRSRAVARLLVEGLLSCTGWLVGCQGHLLTNNHCIDDPALSSPATAAANTDYEFLAEASSCGSPCTGCAGAVWGGAATLVGRDEALDYALIHLAGDPDDVYGSFVLDDRQPIPDERIYIPQHAGGRAKEIAVFSTSPNDASGFCEVFSTDETPCFGGPGDVGYHCDTEQGSSGSPVVAYVDHRVIALHHCANCPNRGVPIEAVIADLGALLPGCALYPGPHPVLETLAIDDSAGNGDGVADPGESLRLAVTLKNDGGAAATGVSGTLATAEPMVAIPDPDAGWPDLPSLGTAASLAPHFTVALGLGVPCGAILTLALDLATDQGPFSIPLQITVGTDLAPTIVRSSTDTPLPIPDNSTTGITSSLVVSDPLTIGDLNVDVDITHPFIGDLVVDLVSPQGTTVRLHARTGGSSDDLVTTYDLLTAPDGPGTMDDFDGQTFPGTWRMRVSDRASRDVGELNGWSLHARAAPQYACNPVGCLVQAALTAAPAPLCAGSTTTLSAGGSTFQGDGCAGGLEYRFEQGGALLRDWSAEPYLDQSPAATATYTLRARDPATLSEDEAEFTVDVLPAPTAAIVQQPEPACAGEGAITLDGGAGFAFYYWFDDAQTLVGTSRTLDLGPAACGRTYAVQAYDDIDCLAEDDHAVACVPCAPPEVSPVGSAVPFRVEAAGSVEFELLAGTDLAYHLYGAVSSAATLTGAWDYKVCDLEVNPLGTWTAGATSVRWTAADPATLPAGLWVVVAERRSLSIEGPYGFRSGGVARAPDADRAGGVANFGCP